MKIFSTILSFKIISLYILKSPRYACKVKKKKRNNFFFFLLLLHDPHRQPHVVQSSLVIRRPDALSSSKLVTAARLIVDNYLLPFEQRTTICVHLHGCKFGRVRASSIVCRTSELCRQVPSSSRRESSSRFSRLFNFLRNLVF